MCSGNVFGTDAFIIEISFAYATVMCSVCAQRAALRGLLLHEARHRRGPRSASPLARRTANCHILNTGSRHQALAASESGVASWPSFRPLDIPNLHGRPPRRVYAAAGGGCKSPGGNGSGAAIAEGASKGWRQRGRGGRARTLAAARRDGCAVSARHHQCGTAHSGGVGPGPE